MTPEQQTKLSELNAGRGKYYVVNPGTILKNVATGANQMTVQEPSLIQDWMYQVDSQGGYGSQGYAWDTPGDQRGQAYNTPEEAAAALKAAKDTYGAASSHPSVGDVRNPGPVSQSITQTRDANGNWVTTNSQNAPNYPQGQVLGSDNQPLKPNSAGAQAPAAAAGGGTGTVDQQANAKAQAEYDARKAAMAGQATQNSAPGGTPAPAASGYAGPSVVDYLHSIGQASDYNSRAALASKYGISNYTGTAAQNTQLLSSMRGANPGASPAINFGSAGGGGAPQTSATGEPVQQTPTQTYQQILSDIYKQMGLTPPDPTVNPITKAANDYQAAATALGIPTINSQLQQIQTQTDSLNKELQDKILGINNNPWLSEGIRTKEIEKLKDSYSTRLDTLAKQQQLYQHMFDKADTQAQYIVTQANNAQKDVMDKAVTMATKIFDSVNTQQKDTNTPDMKEYSLAVSQGFPGTFLDWQKQNANLKAVVAKAGAGGGLTPGQINTSVNSIASQFDNEPIVKAYNTVQEGFQTISNIGVDTKSPADDIAFIYAFAKIMDPNSVVREGEYNTVQQYAQTWADNFGFKAARIFSNTNFLTADAKQKMLNALQPKVNTITNQYTSLQSEYQRQINDAYSGKPRNLTDYSLGVGGGGGGNAKGKQSDSAFVASALKNAGVKYDATLAQAPKGQIAVVDNASGDIGFIPVAEFSSSKYTKL